MPSPRNHEEENPILNQITFNSICEGILTGKITRIVVLVGAGLSTSSGLPDFRTPDTGLYSKLEPLQLPYPDALFHISYFRHTPEPFYAIARVRHPRHARPGVGHAFLALLEKKGVLGFVFTQNIDRLELDAGVSREKVLNVHGDWNDQHCIECKTRYPSDLMRKAILAGNVPICLVENCGGIIKPDVVMFGESLPDEFDRREEEMLLSADLLLVIGTSLKVAPCSEIPRRVPRNVPRVLVNREVVGDFGSRECDVCVLGECDQGLREMARNLGWEEELEGIWKGAVERKQRSLMEEAGGWEDNDGPTLEECVASAAAKMKVRMGVSEGHRRMLEGHLGAKMAGILAKGGQ
ncbi:NAD-dependent protein deacetylase hst2-2 [Aspergillus nidulans var. acristatus]